MVKTHPYSYLGKRRKKKYDPLWSEASFQGFTGLNNKYSNIEIPDTDSPDCMNVEADALGATESRPGYTLVKNFGTQAINSILQFYTQSQRLMLLAYGTTIEAYDPVAKTSTLVTGGLHANGNRFSATMDTVHNKIYMVNGDTTDGLMSWDGTTFTHVANAPNGQYVLWYKNHLYITGDPANPNRLYMSDLGDPTSWPTLNFIDFDDGYGGITGIAQLNDELIIMKESGPIVMKGTDPSDYIAVTVSSGERGAVNHWSIVNIPDAIVYLTRDGFYMYNGRKFELISDKIQGSIDIWNQSKLSEVVAFEYNHNVYWSVPEGASQVSNNYTYAWSTIYGFWYRHDFAFVTGGMFQGSTEEPTPYFTDPSGNLFQYGVGTTDNGNAINAYRTWKHFDFATFAHQKMFRRALIWAEAETGTYTATLTFIRDMSRNATVTLPLGYQNPTEWGQFNWGQANWGSADEIAHYTTNVPGLCRTLGFKVSSNGPFKFYGITVEYQVRPQII